MREPAATASGFDALFDVDGIAQTQTSHPVQVRVRFGRIKGAKP